MIVSAGFADPWVGMTDAVGDEQVGDAPGALVGVDDARLGARAHAAASDEVGVAVDGQRVLRAGGLPDGVQDALGVGDVGAVVVGLRVVHARDRHAVGVRLVGEGDAVVGVGEQLVEDAEREPVVVVAHVLAQRPAPVPVGEHVLGPADRQGPDGLDREAAREAACRVGLVELLRGDLRRRPLVLAHELGEAPGDLRRALHHDVAPDLVVGVGQPVGPARAGGVQQQARASRSSSRRRRPRRPAGSARGRRART